MPFSPQKKKKKVIRGHVERKDRQHRCVLIRREHLQLADTYTEEGSERLFGSFLEICLEWQIIRSNQTVVAAI